MDRNEIIKLMGVLKVAYPSYYKGITKNEALAAIDLWAEMFKNDRAELVGAAVKALIATKIEGFPPTIGAVKEKMHELTHTDEMTEEEAWGIIAKAVRNGLYDSRKEFEKLPEELRKIVHDPAQLKEWATMDETTLHSVVVSNFRRSYRVAVTRKKELDLLPHDVIAVLQGEAERMRLE